MLFNSIDFAIFLPIVFVLYWWIGRENIRSQNVLIVLASYLFYGWWDWRFLSLILFSTVVDYTIGRLLARDYPAGKRKALLWLSLAVNLGLLGYFKYFNFFLDSFTTAFTFFGHSLPISGLNIVLPVGISFYTFQTLSYTIDVYRGKLEPTRDFIAFSAYVSFFPQLVAGPIERATHLLPQFYRPRTFSYPLAVDGMRQILWGLFKKIVIADNCAEFANLIFNDYQDYPGSVLVLGALFFTFQIYGDFSGYSDIAIGTSRLFGFDLMQNFAYPYFSRNIGEFWRRWHISLSTWFRDYLYIPLGGSRGGTAMKVRNTFIIFLVSGFWHGANWTFVIWGLLNALYFLPLLLTNNNRNYLGPVAEGRRVPSLRELSSIAATFALTVFAWIFFRAESLSHATGYIRGIFNSSLFAFPQLPDMIGALTVILLTIGFVLLEWRGRNDQYALQTLGINWNRVTRYGMYYVLIIMLFWFGGQDQQFIYFQF